MYLKFALYIIFRGGGLYAGGLIFGGKCVLVIRGFIFRGLIFGGAYIRDFTVYYPRF